MKNPFHKMLLSVNFGALSTVTLITQATCSFFRRFLSDFHYALFQRFAVHYPDFSAKSKRSWRLKKA